MKVHLEITSRASGHVTFELLGIPLSLVLKEVVVNVLSVFCASVEYSAKPDIGSYRVVYAVIAHTAYTLFGNCTRWPIPVVVAIKYYVVLRFRAQFWGQTNVDDSVFGRQKAFNMPLLHLSVNHPHLCEEYDLLIMSYVFEVSTAQGGGV